MIRHLQLAIYRMIHADNAMITFQKGNEGIWAHNARRIPGLRPGNEGRKLKPSRYSRQVQFNLFLGKSVVPYPDIKFIFFRMEILKIKFMVDGGLPLSIQNLDKGLLLTRLIDGNAGNNGEGFRF